MREVCEGIVYEELLVTEAATRAGITAKTVRQWAAEDATLGAQYARARELSAEALEHEALRVARAATAETSQADRVRIDTLKWAAAKRRPRVYGDQIDITSGGEAMRPAVVALPDLAPLPVPDGSVEITDIRQVRVGAGGGPEVALALAAALGRHERGEPAAELIAFPLSDEHTGNGGGNGGGNGQH